MTGNPSAGRSPSAGRPPSRIRSLQPSRAFVGSTAPADRDASPDRPLGPAAGANRTNASLARSRRPASLPLTICLTLQPDSPPPASRSRLRLALSPPATTLSFLHISCLRSGPRRT